MSNNRVWSTQSLEVGGAIPLVLVTGLIHLVEGPANYADAAYKGLMFYLNAVLALVAVYGIHRNKTWGWGLGLLVTAGAMALYIVSRTVGLPGLEVDTNWFEPIGILSLIVESLFIVLNFFYLTHYRDSMTKQRLNRILGSNT